MILISLAFLLGKVDRSQHFYCRIRSPEYMQNYLIFLLFVYLLHVLFEFVIAFEGRPFVLVLVDFSVFPCSLEIVLRHVFFRGTSNGYSSSQHLNSVLISFGICIAFKYMFLLICIAASTAAPFKTNFPQARLNILHLDIAWIILEGIGDAAVKFPVDLEG